MQIGDLMAFIQYVMHIMFSLLMASIMLIMIPRASVSANRINEVLSLQPTIFDEGNEKADRQRGLLSFEHVTFTYPGARSEEHTSELQSRGHLVCRLLLEKKN